MATPAKWRWDIGNVNATAEQTQKAYRALTVAGDIGKGPTRDFSVIVWNDIVDKIIEQRQAWGDTEWAIAAPATKAQTWLIPGEQMTAKIFNSVVVNMPPIHPWGWEATLGRKEIHKGDICYGAYFLYLLEGLNHWIDLTPKRFVIAIPVHVAMRDKTLVRRALHIINGQNLRWRYSAKAKAYRAMHTKGRLWVNSDIHLNLPLYNTQHVALPLFYNLRMRNKTAATTAHHIIIDNPVQLDLTGRITFSSVKFVISEITGQTDIRGKLLIPPSVRIMIDNAAELISTGDVTVSALDSFAASVLGQFTGEAWAREPDSIAIKEDLQIVQDSTLTFTFSDLIRIVAELNGELFHTAKVFTPDMANILAALDMELEHTAAIRNNGATQFEGTLDIVHDMQAAAYRRRFSTHRADLPVELITSAKVGTAPLELYTAADLLMQSAMSATASFDNNGIYTGADTVMQLITAARAELQNNKRPFVVPMTDMLFSSSAKAAVNPNIMATAVSLSDSMIGSTAKVIINPGNVLPFGAELTDVTEMSATISTFNNQLYTTGRIGAEHTGSGTLELVGAVEFGGNASAEHTGSATFDFGRTARIRAGMGINHTASARITTQRLVLASEIDDILVSELDDTLVNDVEFHY